MKLHGRKQSLTLVNETDGVAGANNELTAHNYKQTEMCSDRTAGREG